MNICELIFGSDKAFIFCFERCFPFPADEEEAELLFNDGELELLLTALFEVCNPLTE